MINEEHENKEENQEGYRSFKRMRHCNTLDDYPQIKGYDFEQPFDFDRFIASFATTGIQAAEVAKGIDTINAMIDDRAKIYLSMTSNIISSGMRENITFLVKHKFVDVIVTAAGAIEEDVLKTMRPFVAGSFDVPGRMLFEQGVGRIGNIFAPFDRYIYLENFMKPFFEKMYTLQQERGRPLSVTEFTHELGLAVNNEESFLYWAAKNDIPVFCPALTDGSIGDLFYFLKKKHDDFYIDIVEDTKKIIKLVLHTEKTGAIILGGGSAKHFVLNSNIFKDGLDYAVYITTAQEFDASDSGGNPQEAITWAKLRVNSLNVKIKCEASVVFPLMVAATFAKRYHEIKKTTKKERFG
jgi:deoxyhypusine synthase